MIVPIKIKLTGENRNLASIIKGDTLIFPDREEIVKVVDRELGKIYAQRLVRDVEERVLYELKKDGTDYILNKDLSGTVYHRARIKAGAKK